MGNSTTFLFYSDVNECSIPIANCQHICIDKKTGFECACHPGYQLHPTLSNLCIDTNECKTRPCSQICINKQGSYSCDCTKGYILLSDKHSCKIEGEFYKTVLLKFDIKMEIF